MTLIAAYRPNGVLILLGDFLITYKGITDVSSRKKIHKISSNFVIGWTGRLNDASLILRNLFERFEDKIVTLQEVESFLTSLKIDEKYQKELILIGWVVEKNLPVCFLWDISVSAKIYYASRHVAGSGGQRFLNLLTQANYWRGTPEGNNTEKAIYAALSEITELYRDETFERMNQQAGFGHGYELLYFNGQEFQYVENIAFSGVKVYWDSVNNTEELSSFPIWYRYHSIGDAAFLQITNLQNGTGRWEMIRPAFKKR